MNISELLSNPSMIHAAVVHMPIAAAFIGLLFVILSAIFHRNNTVRALTALIFLIVVVSAYVAIESGEDARDLVPNTLPTAVWDQISAHKAAAEQVLYAGAFTLICLVLSLIRFDVIRIGGLLLAAVGAIATNIFCASTGHLGGALVYNHGVGTPMVHQAAPAPVTEPVAPPPAPVMPGESAVPAIPAVPTPVPAEIVPVPMPAEPLPAEPMPAALAENPEWLPIREFTAEEAALVSFKRDVWPIIDDQCTSCHENPDADGDYDMTTVESMVKGGKKGGPGVVPGKPDESSIIHYIRGIAKPRMPEDEPPLTDEQVHTLRMWIAAGAKDDSAEASTPAPAVEAPAPTEVPAEPVPAPETAPVVEPAPVEAAPAPAEVAPTPEATPAPEAVAPVESAPVVEEAPAPVEAAPAPAEGQI